LQIGVPQPTAVAEHTIGPHAGESDTQTIIAKRQTAEEARALLDALKSGTPVTDEATTYAQQRR
jgi:hypothetical protein